MSHWKATALCGTPIGEACEVASELVRSMAEVEWDDAIGVHHVRKVLDPSQTAGLLGTPGLAWRSQPVHGYAIFNHVLRLLAPTSLRGRHFLAAIR